MPVKNREKLNLSEAIRYTRKLSGLTQNDLALRAGVGKTLIFELEKGSTRVTLENLLKVLKVLNIELNIQLPVQLPGNK
jgi:y4mF family transcriptional regulator